jgi:hypothetical protein
MAQELSIIIPVLNEDAAFPALWRALTTKVSSPFRAWAVYDHEQDTTLPVLREGERFKSLWS